MKKDSGLMKLSWLLVLVGGINWGLIGLFEWNLVNALIGTWPVIERIVYVLVGLGALVLLSEYKHMMKK